MTHDSRTSDPPQDAPGGAPGARAQLGPRRPVVLRRPRRSALRRIELCVRLEAHRLYGEPGRRAVVAPHRRPARLVLAAAAVVATVGGVAGGAILFQSGDGTVPTDPAAERPIRESGDLRRAPWLFQPDGSPHIAAVAPRRSVQFPRGTTYAQAVNQLVRSVLARGVLPRGTRARAPLPAGVVWQPGTRTRGPRLSLTAPMGYSVPEGRIRVPGFVFGPKVTTDQARALLIRSRRGSPVGAGAIRGVSVAVPKLVRCQINPPGRTPVPCRLDPPPATPPPGN